MKTIIAGSRTLGQKEVTDAIAQALLSDKDWVITQVVCGCANGVDKAGEAWAREGNIPVRHFPADWRRYGRGAGPIRNRLMAEYADALIAVWDGKSKGTLNMLHEAKKRGLKIHLHLI